MKRKRSKRAEVEVRAETIPRRGLVEPANRSQPSRDQASTRGFSRPADDPRVRAGKIEKKVRLLDRANTHVCWLDREKALDLINRNQVEVAGTPRKVKVVRWISAQAEVNNCPALKIRKRSLGDPHRFETETNPKGVWTIDRIQRRHRPAFTRVVDERMTDSDES